MESLIETAKAEIVNALSHRFPGISEASCRDAAERTFSLVWESVQSMSEAGVEPPIALMFPQGASIKGLSARRAAQLRANAVASAVRGSVVKDGIKEKVFQKNLRCMEKLLAESGISSRTASSLIGALQALS